MHRSTIALVSLLSFACCLLGKPDRARAGDPWSSPPIFDQPSYEVFWNVSGPGLHSFELTGYAYDLDVDQTVTIDLSFPHPNGRFSRVDGNPATFVFRMVDITQNYNGYLLNFGLGARAIEEPLNSTGALLTVHFVVPEPSGLLLMASFALVSRRRRS